MKGIKDGGLKTAMGVFDHVFGHAGLMRAKPNLALLPRAEIDP